MDISRKKEKAQFFSGRKHEMVESKSIRSSLLLSVRLTIICDDTEFQRKFSCIKYKEERIVFIRKKELYGLRYDLRKSPSKLYVFINTGPYPDESNDKPKPPLPII